MEFRADQLRCVFSTFLKEDVLQIRDFQPFYDELNPNLFIFNYKIYKKKSTSNSKIFM